MNELPSPDAPGERAARVEIVEVTSRQIGEDRLAMRFELLPSPATRWLALCEQRLTRFRAAFEAGARLDTDHLTVDVLEREADRANRVIHALVDVVNDIPAPPRHR